MKISDIETEEIVITLVIEEGYAIPKDDRQRLLDAIFPEADANKKIFTHHPNGETVYTTVVRKDIDRVVLVVTKKYHGFWVDFLNDIGTRFERICEDVSKFREVRDWDKRMKGEERQ